MKRLFTFLVPTAMALSSFTVPAEMQELPLSEAFVVSASATLNEATTGVTVFPAPGLVKSLKSFTLTFENATEITKGDVNYGNAPYVMGADGVKKYCFNMSFVGNTMTLAVSKEITEYGDYTFVVPSGFYNIDGNPASQYLQYNYTVGEIEDVGIISEQPSGVKQQCQINFLSYFVVSNNLYGMDLAGKPTHYIIGDDDCLYLYNPIIKDAFGNRQINSYIKGVKEGDNYVFYFPQPIYQETVDGETKIYYANYMHRELLEDENIRTYITVSENNNITFTIREDGTCETLNEPNIDYCIGMTDADGKWSGFGNIRTQYQPFNDVEPELPEDPVINEWVMEYSTAPESADERLTTTVDVVTRGNEMWVRGFSQTYCSDAWAHGVIDGDVVRFDPYIGIAESVGQYAFVYQADTRSSDSWIYPLELTLDNEQKTMTCDMDLVVNPNQIFYYALEKYVDPIWHFAEEELTSKIPTAPKSYSMFYVIEPETGKATVSVNLSSTNVDGQPMSEKKLYFQVITEDENVYTFTPDKYSAITEDITDIPYNMTRGVVTGSGIQRNFYVYIPGQNNIGTRMVYKDDTGSYYSEIKWYSEHTGIGNVESNVEVSTKWYDINGREVESPVQGLNIKSVTLSNGTSKTSKVFRK